MSKILIIPDIHGREFWKEALNYNGEVVFLGDYLDPYNFEFNPEGKQKTSYDGKIVSYDIYPSRKKSCIDNFKLIIDFAKNNDKVTLLLGNHDYHYIIPGVNASRKDEHRIPEINKLFLKNRGLFKDFYHKDSLLITHAGVTNEWLSVYSDNPDDIIQSLESTSPIEKFSVSPYRGGNGKYSGPLWEDVHELQGVYKDTLATNSKIKYQIFGHTMLADKGNIVKVDDGACIDSREIFEVNTADPEHTLKIWNRENE